MSLRVCVMVLAFGCSSSGGTPKPAEPASPPAEREPAPVASEEPPPAPAETAPPPAASGSDSKRPAGVTDAHIATAEKLIAIMQKMSADVSAAGSDCAKAAVALTAAGKALEPLKADVQKLEKAGNDDPDVKAWFEVNYMGKMMSTLGPVMQIAQTCNKDPAFTKAMKSLDAGG